MEITIIIRESENGKPSVIVKEGDNPKPNSNKSDSSKNQDSKEKSNSRKEKPKKSKVRSEKELVKRRKELLGIREQIKRDIEKSDNPAELRRELEMLNQTLIEYQWLFKEIQ